MFGKLRKSITHVGAITLMSGPDTAQGLNFPEVLCDHLSNFVDGLKRYAILEAIGSGAFLATTGTFFGFKLYGRYN